MRTVAIVKRTFEALNFAKGSVAREVMNLNPITSEHVLGHKYAVMAYDEEGRRISGATVSTYVRALHLARQIKGDSKAQPRTVSLVSAALQTFEPISDISPADE